MLVNSFDIKKCVIKNAKAYARSFILCSTLSIHFIWFHSHFLLKTFILRVNTSKKCYIKDEGYRLNLCCLDFQYLQGIEIKYQH